jgi:hypothetical protein
MRGEERSPYLYIFTLEMQQFRVGAQSFAPLLQYGMKRIIIAKLSRMVFKIAPKDRGVIDRSWRR